jgi:signal-transduction protein with cAMP-binding, CBS, and nucleotidyltransferase domain
MATVESILKNRQEISLFSVRQDISVYEAVRVMGLHNTGSVLVVNEAGDMLGILTERDYARKIVLQGKRSAETLVGEIMTPAENIVSVTRQTTIEECMMKMNGSKIRHLPVLENGRPITVISIGDVVSAVIREQEFTIKAMNNYIKGQIM